MGKFVPVVLRVYNVFERGANKGKIIPSQYYTLTMFREQDKETVGDVLKRAKAEAGEGQVVRVYNVGQESDKERAKRYKEMGLEIVNSEPEVSGSMVLRVGEVA